METLEGDLFAPVEGRRFDLIASNPPYVVSPSSRFIYRDGGGGALTVRVVKAAGHYLREGGIASIMVNWPERQGVDAADELRRWVDGSGCDTWVIRTGTVPADW